MDELKLLIEMVAGLPSMALWVLVGFFCYKVVVIGSIYGVIRLAIIKMHDWLTSPKRQEVRLMLDGEMISGAKEPFLTQLRRLRNARVKSRSDYVHESDVDWLREAIDEKIVRDSAK